MMNPNEIKKALEEHINQLSQNKRVVLCDTKELLGIFKSNLAYINQLEAEVEQLKANSDSRQTNENIDVAHIKAEVVKAFSEAVKMEFYYEFDEIIPSIMADKIDNLVKEMVGDDK